MMNEVESREFAKTVASRFAGRTPSGMSLVSSGHGPAGWSGNRVWRTDFGPTQDDALVVKVGDGPMADLVLREIDIAERLLPENHVHLPRMFKQERESTPYILMEYLAMVPWNEDIAKTPTSVVIALGEILPSILLAHRSDCLVDELPGEKHISGIPSSLSYGYLNLRNLGKRTDGTLVIFDWDGACRAPLGSDFKLFRCHPAFPEVMNTYHRRCQDCGVSLPPIGTWLQRLLEMWSKEDQEHQARQQVVARNAQ